MEKQKVKSQQELWTESKTQEVIDQFLENFRLQSVYGKTYDQAEEVIAAYIEKLRNYNPDLIIYILKHLLWTSKNFPAFSEIVDVLQNYKYDGTKQDGKRFEKKKIRYVGL